MRGQVASLVVGGLVLVGCLRGAPARPDAETGTEAPACGNGLVEAGEDCDDGPGNGDAAACTSTCTTAVCGDGLVLDGVEECDNGDANDDAAVCTSGCTLAVCGDGLVHVGFEDCDDGPGNADTAACTARCRQATCGDGLVWEGVEACDDRNVRGGDGCGPTCALPRTLTLEDADASIVGLSDGGRASVVHRAGDVNNDGVDDLLVAAPRARVTTDAPDGILYLVHGPIEGTVSLSAAAATFPAAEEVANYGLSARALGDLDNDGFDDFGLPIPSPVNKGYVGYGPFSGQVPLGAFAGQIETPNPLAFARLGDVNGDDRDDLLISDIRASPTFAFEGVVYVLDGPVEGTFSLDQARTTIRGGSADLFFGQALASGDVTGDDIPDLIVGTEFADEGGVNAGAVYIVNGRTTGTIGLDQADARLIGAQGNDRRSFVAFAGDVNGDGDGDLLVGGSYNQATAGMASVVFGPLSGTIDLADADVHLEPEGTSDAAGATVVGPGDVNGDGFDDLVVGAPYADVGGQNVGAVYLVFGPVEGDLRLADADVIVRGDRDRGLVGSQHKVAVGDVDGDGRPDLAIGVDVDVDVGEVDQVGVIYVFSGASL